AVVVVAVAGGLAVSRDSGDASPAPTESVPSVEPACRAGTADYDSDPGNGCEAVADNVDGEPLGDRREATIVPADDTDEYPVEVADHRHLTCDGTLTLTLTAPEGMALRLTVESEAGDPLGEVVSAGGVPGELAIDEPHCFDDDGQTLTARVEPIGSDRVGDPYSLTRSGSF
ncbi:MAG: hypothetical protein ACRD0G_10185, partial [Acidimicrobiales bacterium]